MMNRFGDDFLVPINMWNWESNIIFNTSIYYNKYSVLIVLQIKYSLLVILELNSVSKVQYKDMMIDRWWKVSTGIIDIIKSSSQT